jgi:geranylgeranyl pyrophosphate synthase
VDVYDKIIEEFARMPHVRSWGEVQELFRGAASGKPGHWMLPLRACESAGGTADRAIPVVLAAACSQISIALVDDMLDEDPKGLYLKTGRAAAANMASAFQAAALSALAASGMPPAVKLPAMQSLNEMFSATARGQYHDIKSIVHDENSYWKITRAKSSPFFGAAFQIGALAGGVSRQTAGQIKKLGMLYGEMIQIHDDVNDTLAVPAAPDWDAGRAPLPILFACQVSHPERDRFRELRPYARTDSKVLEEAQEILIRCGAVSYCIHQLLDRYGTAKGMVCCLALERRVALMQIFDDVVQPVFQLFRELDSSFSGNGLSGG